jgi:hypothetical protein
LRRIFIANSVTLATRVRVDILKAMAKLNTNEKESFFVLSVHLRVPINMGKVKK